MVSMTLELLRERLGLDLVDHVQVDLLLRRNQRRGGQKRQSEC